MSGLAAVVHGQSVGCVWGTTRSYSSFDRGTYRGRSRRPCSPSGRRGVEEPLHGDANVERCRSSTAPPAPRDARPAMGHVLDLASLVAGRAVRSERHRVSLARGGLPPRAPAPPSCRRCQASSAAHGGVSGSAATGSGNPLDVSVRGRCAARRRHPGVRAPQ